MKHLLFLFLTLFILKAPAFAQNEIISKAEDLVKAEEFVQAVSLLENELPNYSNNEQLLLLLGKSYMETQDYPKAIDTFSDLTKVDNQNAEYFYLLGEASFEALSNTSSIFKMSTYSTKMKSAMSKALEIDPSHVNARIRLSNFYLNAPMIAGGSSKKALEHAQILKKYDPNLGYQLMASVYKEQEEFEKAEQIYLTMLNEGVEEKRLYYLISVVKFDQKDYEATMDYSEQSMKAHPEYLTAYYQYGKAAAYAGKNFDTALSHLNYFLEHHHSETSPSIHWAHLRLGQIYSLQENTTAAKQAFNKAIELKPDFDEAKKELKKL
ncbi:MAG: tetratricopeptide repeat protein [Balneolaceae bacterium]|nr:tetratricopeptide repeat protein [Balneolaceae bacterium]MBO6544914.1 tetratricopeptide repeat protein [Balneolaceae bacterium]MBO6646310.1 tetratricopeptide repeat protein [Balneolaceae bacterium]